MLSTETKSRIDAVAKATADLAFATDILRKAERRLAEDQAADPDQSVDQHRARLQLLNDLTIGYVVAGRPDDPPPNTGQAVRIEFKIGPVSD